MRKDKALELLGGTTASAAKAIGMTYQAVYKWPDELPPRIADRVLAAVARQRLSSKLTDAIDPVLPKTETKAA